MKADKQIDNRAPCNNPKKKSALKLGTWNVQTMTPGFSDDLQEIDDMCKIAVIDMELSRLQMDILPCKRQDCQTRDLSKKKLILLAGKTIE